jgi:hypothetical protein
MAKSVVFGGSTYFRASFAHCRIRSRAAGKTPQRHRIGPLDGIQQPFVSPSKLASMGSQPAGRLSRAADSGRRLSDTGGRHVDLVLVSVLPVQQHPNCFSQAPRTRVYRLEIAHSRRGLHSVHDGPAPGAR